MSEADEKLNLRSEQFDPLYALLNADRVSIPVTSAKLYDTVVQCAPLLPQSDELYRPLKMRKLTQPHVPTKDAPVSLARAAPSSQTSSSTTLTHSPLSTNQDVNDHAKEPIRSYAKFGTDVGVSSCISNLGPLLLCPTGSKSQVNMLLFSQLRDSLLKMPAARVLEYLRSTPLGIAWLRHYMPDLLSDAQPHIASNNTGTQQLSPSQSTPPSKLIDVPLVLLHSLAREPCPIHSARAGKRAANSVSTNQPPHTPLNSSSGSSSDSSATWQSPHYPLRTLPPTQPPHVQQHAQSHMAAYPAATAHTYPHLAHQTQPPSSAQVFPHYAPLHPHQTQHQTQQHPHQPYPSPQSSQHHIFSAPTQPPVRSSSSASTAPSRTRSRQGRPSFLPPNTPACPRRCICPPQRTTTPGPFNMLQLPKMTVAAQRNEVKVRVMLTGSVPVLPEIIPENIFPKVFPEDGDRIQDLLGCAVSSCLSLLGAEPRKIYYNQSGNPRLENIIPDSEPNVAATTQMRPNNGFDGSIRCGRLKKGVRAVIEGKLLAYDHYLNLVVGDVIEYAWIWVDDVDIRNALPSQSRMSGIHGNGQDKNNAHSVGSPPHLMGIWTVAKRHLSRLLIRGCNIVTIQRCNDAK